MKKHLLPKVLIITTELFFVMLSLVQMGNAEAIVAFSHITQVKRET